MQFAKGIEFNLKRDIFTLLLIINRYNNCEIIYIYCYLYLYKSY